MSRAKICQLQKRLEYFSYSIQKMSPPFGPSRKSSASITSSSSTNSLTSKKYNNNIHKQVDYFLNLNRA